MTIEEFIEKCKKRPIPKSEASQVRLFAKELAEGALLGIWSTTFPAIQDHGLNFYVNTKTFLSKSDTLTDDDNEIPKELTPFKNFARYIDKRWDDNYPSLLILESSGYLGMKLYHDYTAMCSIKEKAFDLIEEVEKANVFISYKRSESSAFTLLISNTLKQYNVIPFVDMQLRAGDDWHAELEENIKNSDYFIVLLGNDTLISEVTVKEIQWAIEGNVTLIPIWHNGFEFNVDDWTDLPGEVSKALSSTHTIRVLEENPLTYDTALRELLNRFGITM